MWATLSLSKNYPYTVKTITWWTVYVVPFKTLNDKRKVLWLLLDAGCTLDQFWLHKFSLTQRLFIQ